jgi:tRNA threonylcarbamoyl adenosine modification protein YeaZ
VEKKRKLNLLGIDASSQNLSLSIKVKGKIIVDFNQKIKFGASKLISYIERNLAKHSLELKDMDCFVIGSGPGSFTCLRISFSIIKAFVITTAKPVIALSSFFSCAYPFRNRKKTIAVISDARRNLTYAAFFKTRRGSLGRNSKEKLMSLEEIVATKKDYLFVTYDSHLRSQILRFDPSIDFYSQNLYPKVKYLFPLAEIYYNEKKFSPIDKLKPLYLHSKTCQIRK